MINLCLRKVCQISMKKIFIETWTISNVTPCFCSKNMKLGKGNIQMEENLHLRSVKLAYGLGVTSERRQGENGVMWLPVVLYYLAFSREMESEGCVYIWIYLCLCVCI